MQTEDEKYKEVMSQITRSYMSNTKWRKLFTAAQEFRIEVSEAIWSFIDTDQRLDWGIPSLSEMSATSILDGRLQPCEYRWIRSIEIPRITSRNSKGKPARTQDIDRLYEQIQLAGEFEIDLTESSIIIYGYR